MLRIVGLVAGLLALTGGALAQLSSTDLAGLQEAYVKASNTQVSDHFGYAVAVSGDTVVISATRESSGAAGVGGNQADNSQPLAGAAYVFVRSGTGWVQQAYLKASNPEGSDTFGDSVAISGDTIVIGASGEDSTATGVNGSQGNGASNAGAAYVFVRSGSTWSQQAYLKSSNTVALQYFGWSVAVSGDTIVVGAWGAEYFPGAACVFVRQQGAWSPQGTLGSFTPANPDDFGFAVAVDGDTIVVGAVGEDSGAAGVNGNAPDESVPQSGAAYVFVRTGGTWNLQAFLTASNPGIADDFGASLALSGDTLVVGAPEEDGAATGVNGHQQSEAAAEAGAAYVFVRTGDAWAQQAYLKASNTDAFDRFGRAVSVSGDVIAVGAHGEASGATGVNGLQSDDGMQGAGAAYVFAREAGAWSQHAYVKASNSGAGDHFARLAVSGDVLVVGAFQEDCASKGVNGPVNENANDSGAAYLFDVGLDPWFHLGSGLAGVAGSPSLAGSGPLTAASAGALDLKGAAPSALAMLFVSSSATPSAFKGGTLVPVPVLVSVPLVTGPTGAIALPFAWPAGIPSQTTLFFQCAIQDPAATQGVALSNALAAVIP